MNDNEFIEGGRRFYGFVKVYNKQRGFGFITADDDSLKNSDVFVHYTGIAYDGNSGSNVRDLHGPQHAAQCPAKRHRRMECICEAKGDRVSFKVKLTARGPEAHGTQKVEVINGVSKA